MDDQQKAYQEIRGTIVERLRRLQIAPSLLEDLSMFQLVGLLHLMVGHLNYVGVYTTTCWTLEQILGKDLFFDTPSETAKKKLDDEESETQKGPVH